MTTRRQDRRWWTLGISAERWMEILLALLVLFVFVGRPVVAEFPAADLAVEIIFSLALASGVAATRRGSSMIIALIALATIVVGWVAWGTRTTGVRELHAVIASIYCTTLAAYVLGEVFRATEVRRHQIEGAVAAYLLIGLAWAFAYNLVYLIRPDSFTFDAAIVKADHSIDGRFLYFSFVTLTTIGYGDITPTISTTEMMAVLEALVGQLFPSVLLARLVSMEIHHRLLREQRDAHRDA